MKNHRDLDPSMLLNKCLLKSKLVKIIVILEIVEKHLEAFTHP